MMKELQTVSLDEAIPHHGPIGHTGGFLVLLVLSNPWEPSATGRESSPCT